MNPYLFFGLLGIGGAVIAAVLLSFILPFSWFGVWLVAINLAAVALYRSDKSLAQSGKPRVPELILLLHEAIGGTIGAAIAMWFIRPRHKTQSGGFLLGFFLIFAIQIVAIIAFFYLTKA